MADKNKTFETVVDVIIRLGFLFLLIAWCLQILAPFFNPILWAILLAALLESANLWLTNKLGGRQNWSAIIITLLMLSMILVPSYLFFDSVVDGLKDLGTALSEGTAKVSPPKDSVKDWPVIGEKIYDGWLLASQNLEGAMDRYSEQLTSLGEKMLSSIVGLTGGILQFMISTIIAGVLLANYESSSSFTKVLFKKIIGDRGEEYAKISADTIRNVGKGILGVALIQSFLFGLGLILAGVPYAGLWALMVLVVAIVQLPAILVAIPVIVYLFTGDSMLSATLWTIYFLAVGASDNFLKPILLGRGASVPMLIVFLGAIGGFVATGFVGLFIGAIVLTLGYKLFVLWLYGPEADATSDSSESDQAGVPAE